MRRARRRPETDPSRAKRRPGRGERLFIAATLFVALGLIVWLSLWDTRTRQPGSSFNRGRNAVWLGHTWVEDAHTDREVDQLVETLRQHQIRYVFAHVGPLEAGGTIPPERSPRAAEFASRLKAAAPELILLAWIGQVESRGGGILDLGDPAVRDRIVATAASYARLPGWDGVHYDIEPLFDGDVRFIAVLDATRQRLGGGFVSVATPKWFLGRRWDRISERGGTAVWSAAYYREVALRVDQLAVMTYDSALPWDRAYTLFVKQETTNILWAVRDTRAEVLIGVPVYHGNNRGFRDYAENMSSGLAGLILGLNNTAPEALPRFAGVAIYPYWEIGPTDWAIYDREWLGR